MNGVFTVCQCVITAIIMLIGFIFKNPFILVLACGVSAVMGTIFLTEFNKHDEFSINLSFLTIVVAEVFAQIYLYYKTLTDSFVYVWYFIMNIIILIVYFLMYFSKKGNK